MNKRVRLTARPSLNNKRKKTGLTSSSSLMNSESDFSSSPPPAPAAAQKLPSPESSHLVSEAEDNNGRDVVNASDEVSDEEAQSSNASDVYVYGKRSGKTHTTTGKGKPKQVAKKGKKPAGVTKGAAKPKAAAATKAKPKSTKAARIANEITTTSPSAAQALCELTPEPPSISLTTPVIDPLVATQPPRPTPAAALELENYRNAMLTIMDPTHRIAKCDVGIAFARCVAALLSGDAVLDPVDADAHDGRGYSVEEIQGWVARIAQTDGGVESDCSEETG